MAERGVLRNAAYAKQQIVFAGMKWGTITPTDIDGFIDFNDRLFVFIEAKYGNAPLGIGQRLALERACDACHNPPRRSSVAFIVTHWSSGDIELAKSTVTGIRWAGKWRVPKLDGQSLVDGIDAFRTKLFEPVAANEPDPWLAEYEAEEERSWAPKTAKELWGR